MKRLLIFITIWISVIPLVTSCLQSSGTNFSMRVYTRSDACGAAETWAKYLGDKKQEDLKGIAVFGDPGLADAVIKDKSGIGYNNIGFAYDIKTGKQLEGLCVIPIDVNENGIIDDEENFYENKSALVKAISEGHYPSPPARDLHLATLREFKGISREFARWILTDGQKYVDALGYVGLPEAKIKQELDKLGPKETVPMNGVITISGAWALYPMVVKWAEEFQKMYPDIKIDVSAGGAGKGMVDVLSGMVNLGMISRNIYDEEVSKGAYWVSVVKDAVVPVANRNNHLINDILTKGLKKQTFIDIWITQQITDWNSAINR